MISGQGKKGDVFAHGNQIPGWKRAGTCRVYYLYLGEAPLLSCLPLPHLLHGHTVGCGHLQP